MQAPLPAPPPLMTEAEAALEGAQRRLNNLLHWAQNWLYDECVTVIFGLGREVFDDLTARLEEVRERNLVDPQTHRSKSTWSAIRLLHLIFVDLESVVCVANIGS